MRKVYRKGWTTEEIKILKQMWLDGLHKEEIARVLKHSRSSVYNKGYHLGLSRRAYSREIVPPEEVGRAPIKGIRKCHNCLEEIKLSKDGLGKRYQGATRLAKWLFWHLPGQCPKDPDTHTNLLRTDLPDINSPGRFY